MMIRFVEGRTACQDAYIPKAVLRKDAGRVIGTHANGTVGDDLFIRIQFTQAVP